MEKNTLEILKKVKKMEKEHSFFHLEIFIKDNLFKDSKVVKVKSYLVVDLFLKVIG